MNNQKYNSLVTLGKFLSQFASFPYVTDRTLPSDNAIYFEKFKETLALATQHNGWFTPDNLQFACRSWAEALTEENIRKWIEKYDLENVSPKTVAIIMAGNIPLVGFHDFLSVLVAGHKAVIKLSSDDKVLLPFIADYLQHIEPAWEGQYSFTDARINDFDAVIATGSDNTARYFEYYFGKKPHIIRKNRNSVAVLTGKESSQELFELGKDIFTYFGLGCRSISKVFVPTNYDFDLFFNAIYPFKDIIDGQKYANNYDYNKAVYLMSLFKLRENGFLLLKEDTSYASPIATLFYEYYDSSDDLKEKLQTDSDKIQCVVAKNFTENDIRFGQTQSPQLWDYADGVDTLAFLTAL